VILCSCSTHQEQLLGGVGASRLPTPPFVFCGFSSTRRVIQESLLSQHLSRQLRVNGGRIAG